ncbi:MAG: S-methyl-5-thioribose-1-phosphate isomerase [Candidatus Wallbacteria bacterium]|nr:S-methyl-5-thioribose-1-phosphate isomerase [Candidatus Wallbacteria bacterium]
MTNARKDLKTFYFEDGTLFLLNQLKLPLKIEYIPCRTVKQVARAIRKMIVRGAPAIGVTAAYGMALAAREFEGNRAFVKKMERSAELLRSTRPTAVNLAWALERMRKLYSNSALPSLEIAILMLREAVRIDCEDLSLCRKIGAAGAELIAHGDGILTHCNAGALATAGWGTALGVIRSAHESGKKIRVFIDETRPYLQGARITALEIMKMGIECYLICDNMAGYMMKKGEIRKVIVGADRIAANGDTANKIGTYSLAVLASYHNIPFFVAAPVSTFDLTLKSGELIPIEERPECEITTIRGKRIAPLGVKVKNPAFDVTPAELISAIITEHGIVRPPFQGKLAKLEPVLK